MFISPKSPNKGPLTQFSKGKPRLGAAHPGKHTSVVPHRSRPPPRLRTYLLREPRYDRKRPEPETETGARLRGPGRQARGLERARGGRARARAAPAAGRDARDSECVSRGGGGGGGGSGGGGMRSPAPLARWRYNSKVWRGRDQRQPQQAGPPDPRASLPEEEGRGRGWNLARPCREPGTGVRLCGVSSPAPRPTSLRR